MIILKEQDMLKVSVVHILGIVAIHGSGVEVKGGGYCPGDGVFPSGSGDGAGGIAVEIIDGSGVIVGAVTVTVNPSTNCMVRTSK